MRKKNLLNIIFFSLNALFLTACGLFDRDNTPIPARLVDFCPEVKTHFVYKARTGSSVGKEYMRMGPAVNEKDIFTASTRGLVTSTNKFTGRRNWQLNTHYALSTSPAVDDCRVIVGGQHGEVIALSQQDGHTLWVTSVPGEILAQPAIQNGVVVIKAVDGYLRALSLEDGHELWSIQHPEPTLILRASSAPQIRDHHIVVGFASGNLAKVDLRDGQLLWQRQIAAPDGVFPIQRMVDIDADPLIYDNDIYTATYQGNISSVDWVSGKILWSHDISSYTGMAADENTVYITDANSFIWAFSENGAVKWRQAILRARRITAPAVMGNYIVVGDQEGYVHWLNKEDGRLAARVRFGSAIFATPLAENNIVYILDNNGYLGSYILYQ